MWIWEPVSTQQQETLWWKPSESEMLMKHSVCDQNINMDTQQVNFYIKHLWKRISLMMEQSWVILCNTESQVHNCDYIISLIFRWKQVYLQFLGISSLVKCTDKYLHLLFLQSALVAPTVFIFWWVNYPLWTHHLPKWLHSLFHCLYSWCSQLKTSSFYRPVHPVSRYQWVQELVFSLFRLLGFSQGV